MQVTCSSRDDVHVGCRITMQRCCCMWITQTLTYNFNGTVHVEWDPITIVILQEKNDKKAVKDQQ